jgi:nucleoside-diphosphate-sugar epimerase
MRILVVGAGRTGAKVLRQLQKNPAIQVITADPRPDPYAVEQGIIPAVDLAETLTPLTLEYVIEQARPDMILLAMASDDLGLGDAPGIDVLADALRQELAALGEVPIIEVARARSG